MSEQSDMPNKDNCTSVYNGLFKDDKCYMCPHSYAPSITPMMTPSGPACGDIAPYKQTYTPDGGTTINNSFLNKVSSNTPTPTPADTILTPSSVSYSCSSGELQNIGTLNNPNYLCNMKTDIVSCVNNYNLINIITPSSTTYNCSNTLPLSCKTGDTLINTSTTSEPNYQCQTVKCGLYGKFTSSGDMCNVKPYSIK
jgi:hypothetical protein